MFKIFNLLDQNNKISFYYLVFLMFLVSVLEIINISLIIPIIYSLSDVDLHTKYFFIKYFDQLSDFISFDKKLYLFLILFIFFFLIKNLFLLLKKLVINILKIILCQMMQILKMLQTKN